MKQEFIEPNVLAAVTRGVEIGASGGKVETAAEVAGLFYIIAEIPTDAKAVEVEVVKNETAADVVTEPAKKTTRASKAK